MMKWIILHAQQRLGKERSVFGLYHILQGRSSIQTIQDAKLYQLQRFYGVYRELGRNRFVAIVEDLREKDYLQRIEPDYYVLSSKGESWLVERALTVEPFYLNGEKYRRQDRTFFNRLQLLIQVWTNIKKGNRQFIPVIEEQRTANWVKSFYQRTKTKIDTYLFHLHQELQEMFLSLPDIYPELFLSQFSSYHHIGKTVEQLALEHQLSTEDVDLMTTNVLHYMFDCVNKTDEKYPVLHTLMNQLQQHEHLTNSAAVTAGYLAQGCTVEEIANKRFLKMNTVYDHIVELNLHSHPMIVTQDYIADNEIREIEQAVAKTNSYRLKAIKEVVGEDVSYFQIRFVLAMMDLSQG